MKIDIRWWRRKKTEHTNIARSSLKLLRQNIHVMLSYAIITKRNTINIKHRVVLQTALILILCYDFMRASCKLKIKRKKEKNGAHKHLSSSLKLLHQKYSRHVVLCKYNPSVPLCKYPVVCYSITQIIYYAPRYTSLQKRRRKKTEHTNISPLL